MNKTAFTGGPKTVTVDSAEALRWPRYGKAEEDAALAVIRSGSMSGTDITEKFEKAFADWIGRKYGLCYMNGTAALEAAMFAVGMGAGDELICPSLTYWASCIQAYSFNSTVAFCDIDPQTLCIDPSKIEALISPRTKAIMAVHYLGHPCDMDAIMAIAKKHGLYVIEDVSHAQGGLYKGRRLGTIGDIGAMSLMSGKSFAIGEGGILVTDNRKMYERALAYSHYERNDADHITDPWLLKLVGLPLGGLKGRLNQIASAIGLVQLEKYDETCAQIRRGMNYFWDLLEGVPGIRAHRVDESDGSNMAGWYCPHGLYFPEQLGGLKVTKFCAAVRAEGVPDCTPGANRPLHTHPMMQTADLYNEGKPTRIAHGRDLREASDSLPVSLGINERVFQIPWFKIFDKTLIEQCAAAFRKVCLNYREILEEPTEYPDALGAWFNFGQPKA